MPTLHLSCIPVIVSVLLSYLLRLESSRCIDTSDRQQFPLNYVGSFSLNVVPLLLMTLKSSFSRSFSFLTHGLFRRNKWNFCEFLCSSVQYNSLVQLMTSHWQTGERSVSACIKTVNRFKWWMINWKQTVPDCRWTGCIVASHVTDSKLPSVESRTSLMQTITSRRRQTSSISQSYHPTSSSTCYCKDGTKRLLWTVKSVLCMTICGNWLVGFKPQIRCHSSMPNYESKYLQTMVTTTPTLHPGSHELQVIQRLSWKTSSLDSFPVELTQLWANVSICSMAMFENMWLHCVVFVACTWDFALNRIGKCL